MEGECDGTNISSESVNEKESAESDQINEDKRQDKHLRERIKDATEVDIKDDLSQSSNSGKTETNEILRQDGIPGENGKKKTKEEKQPTKLVVRRLPPTMTETNFLEQITPVPPYDYMYFVQGDPAIEMFSFSRAYLNFINQEDIFIFTETYDNYVFFDTKGQEYPAVVEFAPFQRVPKQRSKKKDPLCGTIECDPIYIAFKEQIQAEIIENSKPGSILKQHYFETEISKTEEIYTTPLLEFLKQKKVEKARIRDERREEKKRKDSERKMKQKFKDRKGEGEDDDAKDVKIHCNPNFSSGKVNSVDKDDVSLSSNRLEKEKILKVNSKEKVNERNCSNKQEVIPPFKTALQMKIKCQPHLKEKSCRGRKESPVICQVSGDKLKCNEEKKLDTTLSDPSEIVDQDKLPVSCGEKKITDKTKFTTVMNMDSKRSENVSNNNRDKILELLEFQKAEQQSQYLKKILGISSNENLSQTETKTEGNEKKTKDCPKEKKNQEKPNNSAKVVITSQSQHNINPALPSASFKNSSNHTPTSHLGGIPPIPQPGTPPFPSSRRDGSHSPDTCSKIDVFKDVRQPPEKIPGKRYSSGFVDPSIVTMSESRPLRGEVIIDKALSTNNLLPSAFKKIQNKPS